MLERARFSFNDEEINISVTSLTLNSSMSFDTDVSTSFIELRAAFLKSLIPGMSLCSPIKVNLSGILFGIRLE